MNDAGTGGVWLPEIPAECVIIDCGPPPLGVHAFPPEVCFIVPR